MTEDGWQRLHPATPLLRGGVVLLAILIWVVVQLRDLWLTLLLGDLIGQDPDVPEDPATRWVLGNVGLALLIVAGVIAAILLIGWLSWRMHAYRVTDEVVEEREGIIWRKHRRARLDRIQGVNVERPLIARIFGAARLVISVAGEDANIRLYALRSAVADELRGRLLQAASVARAAAQGVDPAALGLETPPAAASETAMAGTASAGILEQRLREFTAPEFDAELEAPDSIVRMHVGRLLGSTALSVLPPLIVFAAVALVPGIIWRQWAMLFLLVPGIIGFGAYAISRITRSLRYSIAATTHGIRVGFGLLSTTNETLPPGRIHAIEVTQPLLWRPFGWWSIRINRASRSSRDGAGGQSATSILPVGDLQDVERVIALILPGLDLREAFGRVDDGPSQPSPPAYVTSPRRARIVRWWSWRRNGYAITEDAVLLRKGAIWRTLTIVPHARVQSVALSSGPIARGLGLRRVAIHTVAGTIIPTIGALDPTDAVALWERAEDRTLEAMSR